MILQSDTINVSCQLFFYNENIYFKGLSLYQQIWQRLKLLKYLEIKNSYYKKQYKYIKTSVFYYICFWYIIQYSNLQQHQKQTTENDFITLI